MKRKLFLNPKAAACKAFLLGTALFIFSAGFSQKVTLGARTGFSLSNWNLGGVSGVEPLSLGNPGAGVFATLPVSRSFSIEPGISFAYSGSKLKYSDIENITSKLTYLQIPIVARYELRNGISFFAGPQIGFLLKATMSENDGEKQNAQAVFKKNDLSIMSGLEYYLPAGIGIRLNYTAGLTDIYSQGSEKITNYSYGISIAYKFAIEKRKATSKK